jgi:hypothetical protein
MESFDEDYRVFESRVNSAGEKSVFAKFYLHPELDKTETSLQGRPIYKDREYVEIQAAGNQNNIVIRPASDMDRNRFRGAYQAFKEFGEDHLVGTPLKEVPWLTRSQVEELAYWRIRTLEQLAGVNDDVVLKVPGLGDLRKRAIFTVEKVASDAPVAALQTENDQMKLQIQSMQQALTEQTKLLKELKEKK